MALWGSGVRIPSAPPVFARSKAENKDYRAEARRRRKNSEPPLGKLVELRFDLLPLKITVAPCLSFAPGWRLIPASWPVTGLFAPAVGSKRQGLSSPTGSAPDGGQFHKPF